MADDFGSADADAFSAQEGAVHTNPPDYGLNAELIILVVVIGTVLIFIIGNYALFTYAKKTLPAKKKKPVSKKKMKRERLKAGVAPAGD